MQHPALLPDRGGLKVDDQENRRKVGILDGHVPPALLERQVDLVGLRLVVPEVRVD